MSTARVARFPGMAGRIPDFTGAEAAAVRLRPCPAWVAAGHPAGQPGLRAVPAAPPRAGGWKDGVHGRRCGWPGQSPFFALDPAHL